jgi:ketosteroid isomerase-like protein
MISDLAPDIANGDFLMSSSSLPQQNSEHSTLAVIERFNEAFNRHDADLLALLLTDDTVFEDTSPPPDGKRVEGKTDVAAY